VYRLWPLSGFNVHLIGIVFFFHFRDADGKPAFVSRREVYRKNHWDRFKYGSKMLLTVRDAMVNAGR
jgi:hypothetical protein